MRQSARPRPEPSLCTQTDGRARAPAGRPCSTSTSHRMWSETCRRGSASTQFHLDTTSVGQRGAGAASQRPASPDASGQRTVTESLRIGQTRLRGRSRPVSARANLTIDAMQPAADHRLKRNHGSDRLPDGVGRASRGSREDGPDLEMKGRARRPGAHPQNAQGRRGATAGGESGHRPGSAVPPRWARLQQNYLDLGAQPALPGQEPPSQQSPDDEDASGVGVARRLSHQAAAQAELDAVAAVGIAGWR
jgi:hypothetical protein